MTESSQGRSAWDRVGAELRWLAGESQCTSPVHHLPLFRAIPHLNTAPPVPACCLLFVSHCPGYSQLQGHPVPAHILCGCGHSSDRRAMPSLFQIRPRTATVSCTSCAQLYHIGYRRTIAINPTSCTRGFLSPASQHKAVCIPWSGTRAITTSLFRNSWGYQGSKVGPGS